MIIFPIEAFIRKLFQSSIRSFCNDSLIYSNLEKCGLKNEYHHVIYLCCYIAGTDLIFVIFPDVFSTLELPPVWPILLYLSFVLTMLHQHVSIQLTLLIQGTTLTFAATCPVGQERFNFHLPYSNFHLPLKNCMFYNVSFKTK